VRGRALREPLAEPAALFEWAAAHGGLDDLVRCLAAADAGFPAEWLDADRWPRGFWDDSRGNVRAALVAWSLAVPSAASSAIADTAARSAPERGAAERLAELLAARGLSPSFVAELAPVLRRAVESGERESVDRFLASARRALPPGADALDRLEVLCGLGDAGAEERVLAGATSATGADLMCLGAMAAGAHGEKARASLVGAIGTAPVPLDLVAALGRALAELRAARSEKDERAFVGAVRDAARAADPKLRALLRPDVWPAAQKSVVVRLSELDRHVAASGL